MTTVRSNKKRLPPSCTLKGHGKEHASYHILTRQELVPERHVKLLHEPTQSLEEQCAQSRRRPKSLQDGCPFIGCDVNVIVKIYCRKHTINI